MSASKNLEYKKTSFLNKSNNAFIEQMYLKFINRDNDLPESWRKYFLEIGEEFDIIAKEINGPSWNPIKKKINLDISKINQNDEKVFSLLSTGETTGLFQLESAGMREAIKQMKPTSFDDIIALVALYRPGPMSNIPIYNDCKNGKREPDYLHPKLKEILKPVSYTHLTLPTKRIV